jgi:hypothetical protein
MGPCSRVRAQNQFWACLWVLQGPCHLAKCCLSTQYLIWLLIFCLETPRDGSGTVNFWMEPALGRSAISFPRTQTCLRMFVMWLGAHPCQVIYLLALSPWKSYWPTSLWIVQDMCITVVTGLWWVYSRKGRSCITGKWWPISVYIKKCVSFTTLYIILSTPLYHRYFGYVK